MGRWTIEECGTEHRCGCRRAQSGIPRLLPKEVRHWIRGKDLSDFAHTVLNKQNPTKHVGSQPRLAVKSLVMCTQLLKQQETHKFAALIRPCCREFCFCAPVTFVMGEQHTFTSRNLLCIHSRGILFSLLFPLLFPLHTRVKGASGQHKK